MSEPSYETKLRDRVALIALKRQDPHRGTLGGQDAVGIADAFMRERARRLAAEQERAGEQAEAWRYFRSGAEARRVRAHDVYELRRNTWRLTPHAPSEDWYAAAKGWHEITRAEAEAGMVDEPAAARAALASKPEPREAEAVALLRAWVDGRESRYADTRAFLSRLDAAANAGGAR